MPMVEQKKGEKLSEKEQRVRRMINKRTKSPRLTRLIGDILFNDK